MRLTDLRPTEAQIQNRLVDSLRRDGYTVVVVAEDWKDQNPALPHVLVTHAKWCFFVWIGIVVTRDALAKPTAPQRALADQGRLLVTWDEEHALKVIEAMSNNAEREAHVTVLRAQLANCAESLRLSIDTCGEALTDDWDRSDQGFLDWRDGLARTLVNTEAVLRG